jgi:uncharacterized Fe-S cluster-containing radical SAM superfamily protein
MPMPVDTDKWSERYRSATLDLGNQRVLVTNLAGTGQECDVSEPLVCSGFGRIRHFRRAASKGWPENPLPIDPAARALGLDGCLPEVRAVVFQNAACNWRCWYCFVPFDLLSANPKTSSWLGAKELVDLYLRDQDHAPVLDLSGGQPELTPEWVLWVMTELKGRGLEDSVYLWSDDNLSTDYFWRYLSLAQQEFVAEYQNYGRVGCFKGFDEQSFAYNTATTSDVFERQFDLMRRYLTIGIDMYAYVTFTTPNRDRIREKMSRFVDRLRALNVNLPLRTVPLEVQTFSPVLPRLNAEHVEAIANQRFAVDAWQGELAKRFPADLLRQCIGDVPLRHLRAGSGVNR